MSVSIPQFIFLPSYPLVTVFVFYVWDCFVNEFI